jgi:octaprenyl-diphosphate synthase
MAYYGHGSLNSNFYPLICHETYLVAAYSTVIDVELAQFEAKFKEAVKSRAPLLDRITYYIINRKGKQLRPRFVLLSAKLFGPVSEKSYRAASLVELLHTATLVHDDVVDESLERRSFFSINALWKNKVAVLVGDYLLSKGLLLSLDNQDFETLSILSTAVRKMSEGELLQIEKSRKLNLDEEVYLEIIRNKTASLLASACAAGAWSTSENKEATEKMRSFGELVGMAFQMKDDLFDYGSDDVGKPTGNDIKEKKLTLPLIYTLNNVSPDLRRKMIYTIKNENRQQKRVKWVIDQVVAAGGIAYASAKMDQYRLEASNILNDFGDSEVKNALLQLVEFTTNRKY